MKKPSIQPRIGGLRDKSRQPDYNGDEAMRKEELRGGHWERHGDYWILHDEQGRPTAILLALENGEEQSINDEQRPTSAV